MSFRSQQQNARFSRNGLRNYAFQEKDSEMSSGCCFLFEKRAREGGCQGASGLVNSYSFDSGGAPFFEAVFRNHCFIPHCNVWPKWAPKCTQKDVFRKLLFRTRAKTEKCIWIEPARTDCIWDHPLERSGRPKNQRKKLHISEPPFQQTKKS